MMVKHFHDRVAFKPISFSLTTDDELAAAASFDETAFAELINRHRARVARLAHRFFQQPDEIE